MSDQNKSGKDSHRINVGEPDTKTTAPTHVKGTTEANDPGHYESQAGMVPKSGGSSTGRATGTSTAARSTGISPKSKNPIDPKSPNLSPA